MILQNKKIAIVGGGPGGLTLARLLQQKGLHVTVYERDVNRQVRVQGATLDLHTESGLKALEEAGLINEFKNHYRPGADKMRIVDETGAIRYDQHAEESTETFGDAHFRPEIDRGPLRDILLDSLKPGTVVWDSHILSLDAKGDGWLLRFKNGMTAEADLVIACDGANSKLRPIVTPILSFYSGVTIIEGTVYDSEKNTPRIHELLKGGKIFAFGDSKTIIVSSKGDGSLAFYTGLKAASDWFQTNSLDYNDQRQLLQWFKQEYKSWNPVWHELFSAAKANYTVRPLHCMPLDQNWEANPNITLLGDAAHLMPPYAGEGVNMAMLDALELSQCLTDPTFKETKTAIAHYEKHMRARASKAAEESMNNTAWMHAPDGLKNMLDMFDQIPG